MPNVSIDTFDMNYSTEYDHSGDCNPIFKSIVLKTKKDKKEMIKVWI